MNTNLKQKFLPDEYIFKQGDKGTPIVESFPENEVSKIYLELASKIKSIYLLN